MEMDWPSTFRADLSIQTYLSLTGVAKNLSFSFDSYIKGMERTRHATIPMMHIHQTVNTFAGQPALRNFQSNERRRK